MCTCIYTQYLRLVSNFIVHNSVAYTKFFTDFQVDGHKYKPKGKKRVRERNLQHIHSKSSNLECCLFQLFLRKRQKGSNDKNEDLTKKNFKKKYFMQKYSAYLMAPHSFWEPLKSTKPTQENQAAINGISWVNSQI